MGHDLLPNLGLGIGVAIGGRKYDKLESESSFNEVEMKDGYPHTKEAAIDWCNKGGRCYFVPNKQFISQGQALDLINNHHFDTFDNIWVGEYLYWNEDNNYLCFQTRTITWSDLF